MGLMQKAVETYNCHQHLVGQYLANYPVLAPVGHIVTRADIEIQLSAQGTLLNAEKVPKNDPKIIIPVTEQSAGRAGSGIAAHPLCDPLCYLAGYNEEKHTAYLSQLERWAQSEYSHPKLPPILAYIRSGTILPDLAAHGLVTLDAQGRLGDDEDLLVRWRVAGLEGGGSDACWQDPTLFDSFIRFYQVEHSCDPQCICMITGHPDRRAIQHAKGVVALHGNAKIISANDNSGFTYRGRFTTKEQALEVGYEASQKAHNALRWLAAGGGVALPSSRKIENADPADTAEDEQRASVTYGGRVFLCWNPQGRPTPGAAKPFLRVKKSPNTPPDYREELKRTLAGYRTQLPDTAGVVVAAFDAATSGRLSLTYYNELTGSDFLERLHHWDSTCCWYSGPYGIQSPPLWQIVHCALGTQQSEKGRTLMKADDRVLRQQMQRLVACRIDRAPFPTDLMMALFHRASNPLGYDNTVRGILLTTACAVIKKYHYDRYKEDWSMNLEPEKKDRSYQFGRLLAVLEKAERDTYKKGEEREPNAIRYQSMFCRRPMSIAYQVEKQLNQAYFPKLKVWQRDDYRKLIGEIMEQISQFPDKEWDKPLTETYLMGYYLQRKDLYTPNTDKNEEENQNGSAE